MLEPGPTYTILPLFGGVEEDRTPDPLRARQVLSQLSYDPDNMPPVASNRENSLQFKTNRKDTRLKLYLLVLHCKEVIQPQVPLRLPCYDFTPVMNHTVVKVPLAVKLSTSGATHSHGVTGGVYKARERIHRNMLICDY